MTDRGLHYSDRGGKGILHVLFMRAGAVSLARCFGSAEIAQRQNNGKLQLGAVSSAALSYSSI